MEIKRFGDEITIELHKHKLTTYWSRNLKFGENLIKRLCERITDKELNEFCWSISAINSAKEKGEQLSKTDFERAQKAIFAVAKQINIQIVCRLSIIDATKLSEFVNACYPLVFKTSINNLRKIYNERFEGIETEKEREICSAKSFIDYIVTRQFIAKLLMNDIFTLLHMACLKDGGKLIQQILHHPSPNIRTMSFFLQFFNDTPYHSNLNLRSFEGELQDKYRKKISGIYKELISHPELKDLEFAKVNVGNFDKVGVIDALYLEFVKAIHQVKDIDLINRMGQFKELLESLYRMYPLYDLTADTYIPYTKTNEERKEIILNFFKEWDAILPQDIEWLAKTMEMTNLINAERQERVDKEDIATVGKTQAQIQAEREQNGTLSIEVKDEEGNVVHESTIN